MEFLDAFAENANPVLGPTEVDHVTDIEMPADPGAVEFVHITDGLKGSTPSKPASLIALNFSRTEPLTPTVAYMTAFLMRRLWEGLSAATPAGSSATTASTLPLV